MQDILIRIETDDFAAWEKQHYLHAANRATFGIHDGPAYRDLENPNAALFHIRVENMDRAMEWFESDTFRAATKLAKVTGRSFYEAHPRARN
jgi:heme-degrading monooxygenase HmoA